ncbi:hypothetical protein Psuf_031030 [Phytohabitans suffuscus]|uniref:Uncharacterized protein n=1 Tax=Phytohabitans suffuscus TaxID=624315 RepID=A0A6F8YI79_9ACTN|nr:hypothetical protein Psuf_031030 [Phytohabitans suffuscus]
MPTLLIPRQPCASIKQLAGRHPRTLQLGAKRYGSKNALVKIVKDPKSLVIYFSGRGQATYERGQSLLAIDQPYRLVIGFGLHLNRSDADPFSGRGLSEDGNGADRQAASNAVEHGNRLVDVPYEWAVKCRNPNAPTRHETD